MGWKELAEKHGDDLATAQAENRRLHVELAEHDEQLAAAASARSQNVDSEKLRQQVVDLQLQLKKKDDQFTQQTADAELTLKNTFDKLRKTEQQRDEQHKAAQSLRNQLAGKNEQLRNVQANRTVDHAPGKREEKLQKQVDNLKDEMGTCKADNARLHKQLQAEKDNASRLAGMVSKAKHGHDEDDEEPLPRSPPALTKKPTAAIGGAPTALSLKSAGLYPFKSTAMTPPKRTCTPLAPLKAKSKSKPQLPSPQTPKVDKKRKRSRLAEIKDELPELQLDASRYPDNPRKRQRPSYSSQSNDEVDEDADAVASPADGDFHFIAITDYHPDGEPMGYDSRTDLQGQCEDLWSRIEIVQRTIWEKNAGEDWRWDLEKLDWSVNNPLCVSQKLQRGARVKWRPGCEGKYACTDCVKAGRPCFTWMEQEFRLLPLCGEDRVKAVVVGKNEIRYWVNDSTKLVDTDAAGSDDDDYV